MNETEALGLIQNWFLLNRDEWRTIWNNLPENVKETVLDTFLLREQFHQCKRFLLQLPIVVPAYMLASNDAIEPNSFVRAARARDGEPD